MPLPMSLQRSYLQRNQAVQDQSDAIARRLVQRGEPASPDETGGQSPLAPVNADDAKPTDTVSSDIYTGGAATKLKTVGGDYNFQDSIARRLGTVGEIGAQATVNHNQRLFNQRAQAAQERMNNAQVGYSFDGSQMGGSAPVDGRRGQIIKGAEKLLGQPYKWGGESFKEGGFDCSGLIQYVYGQYGVNTPRVSQQQARMGRVTRNIAELKPGDFIAWDRGGSGGASHIAIYAGNGRVIESPRTGLNVRYRAVNMNEPGIYGVALNI